MSIELQNINEINQDTLNYLHEKSLRLIIKLDGGLFD